MQWLRGLSNFEKQLLKVCGLLMLLCIYVLSNQNLSRMLFFNTEKVPKMPSQPASDSIAKGEAPQLVAGEPTLIYIWKVSDFYETSGGGFTIKVAPQKVPVNHVLHWESKVEGPFDVLISIKDDFNGERMHLVSETSTLEIKEAFTGDNFWRVGRDTQFWSQAARFNVRGTYSDDQVQGVLQGGVIQWKGSGEVQSYIVEASRSPQFPIEATRATLSNDSNFKVTFSAPGVYYFRSRGLNSRQELTDFSNTVTVKIKN